MSGPLSLLATAKLLLKPRLSDEERKFLRLQKQYLHYRLRFPRDLPKLAELFGTDKWGSHRYAQHYQRHFAPLRLSRVNLLEMGVGGYDDPEGGGHSLRMWRTYFPRGTIYGIDVHDKRYHDEPRIKTFRGSQADESFLRRVAAEIGRLDIVIDDGSHINREALTAFATLFPLLGDGGIYAIEDTQTSYWPDFGGSSDDLNAKATTMGFLKALADGMNYEEIPGAYEPDYFARHIVSLHFYHNLAFIYKGMNAEGSTRFGRR